jgi:hypothetical protein
MIKVATIKMGQYHASEHYRIEGPFKELANQGLIEWIRLSDDDIAEYQLNGIDIFFFWNPSHPVRNFLHEFLRNGSLCYFYTN